MLALRAPIAEADTILTMLIERAAETNDNTLSNEFVKRLRERKLARAA